MAFVSKVLLDASSCKKVVNCVHFTYMYIYSFIFTIFSTYIAQVCERNTHEIW